MTIEGWQILVICLFAFIQIIDVITVNVGLGYPLNAGMITGLIMGDVTTGLAVGATLQLMVLGVGTYGGASIPDFTTGAIIGTIFAVISGKGIEFAIGLAVPVGLLLIQLDILARFLNTFSCIASSRLSTDWISARLNVTYSQAPFPGGCHECYPCC